MNKNAKKFYKEINDVWGLPQEYKGVKLYPLKLQEVEYLDLLYSMLGNPQKYIPDATILKMSYLKFLIYAVFYKKKDPVEVKEDLEKLLSHITRRTAIVETAIVEHPSNDMFDKIVLRITVGDMVVDENNEDGLSNAITLREDEFGYMREIILEQNGIGVDYIDDFDPELEKKLQRMHMSSEVTILDEVFTFCGLINGSIEDVAEYTLFQFKMQMEKAMALLDYKIYRPLEASGDIEVKGGKIPHFLYHSNRGRGRYDDMFIRKDQYVANSELFKA